MSVLSGVRAVVFDVGETLVDETRAWTELARHAGVTPFTLMATLGALIERDVAHRQVWDALGVPAPGRTQGVEPADLYDDALSTLDTVRDAGFLVGIAGNQPIGIERQLAAAGFVADFVASSQAWGTEKPSSAFFDRIVERTGTTPDRILYVGDRLDNDVLPARRAGMRTAFIRRGPWGHLHAGRPEAKLADVTISSLQELPPLLG
ncbi:haloacid dehalogenase superfamily, subfamily IA, variant 1 with third motif having Dx(3-4)D or Dx(3-4)E [Curtobacterium sp. 9128]|uniref:HAD family hydrolase n=1 Tax=Curtobacterium sp. 9128 TaxID=1793722 RepID=UPI0007D7123C|nr:HAD family hydrolase [Curtobacterium sp. 9128]SBN61820.1 haloacid dehalogenase superfamily, subfamily IA, variant 1 with third motif having Dx(3-4)D or Dx(3-4)E [Curtobacterium sp. 9128]